MEKKKNFVKSFRAFYWTAINQRKDGRFKLFANDAVDKSAISGLPWTRNLLLLNFLIFFFFFVLLKILFFLPLSCRLLRQRKQISNYFWNNLRRAYPKTTNVFPCLQIGFSKVIYWLWWLPTFPSFFTPSLFLRPSPSLYLFSNYIFKRLMNSSYYVFKGAMMMMDDDSRLRF